MKTFHFVNKSCNRRQEEVQMVKDFFTVNDWAQEHDLKTADLIILFTCAFCQSKVIDMVNEIDRIKNTMKRGAELMVGSCLPKTDKESLEKVFNGKTINPTDFSALNGLSNIKEKIATLPQIYGKNTVCLTKKTTGLRNDEKISLSFLKKYGPSLTLKEIISRSRQLFFPDKRIGLFLSAGCVNKCSYCAIKFATGNLRSKPLDVVMKQFNENLRAGYRKIELYADSIGDYGLDVGTNLEQLFDQLMHIEQSFSIGIYDLYPASFIKYFKKIVSLSKAGKIHYLYVPLQSGNERILKLMNRPCDTSDLKKKLIEVKKNTQVFMQTSIIVGFPTETSEEFEDTLRILKDIDFTNVFVHFYSDMPNTESSKLSGKIDNNTMQERLNKLNNSGIKHDFNQTMHEWENVLMAPRT